MTTVHDKEQRKDNGRTGSAGIKQQQKKQPGETKKVNDERAQRGTNTHRERRDCRDCLAQRIGRGTIPAHRTRETPRIARTNSLNARFYACSQLSHSIRPTRRTSHSGTPRHMACRDSLPGFARFSSSFLLLVGSLPGPGSYLSVRSARECRVIARVTPVWPVESRGSASELSNCLSNC